MRALDNGEPATLPEATAVLWILLDLHCRNARDLFWGGRTSGEWITTGYQQFVPALIGVYDTRAAMA